MSALVSIIIPTYNNDKFIIRAVESALNQTFPDIEVIVVNDGSIDETESKLSDFISGKKIEYYFQNNKGVSSARNLGITKASGDYLLFLDADDVLTPNGVSDLVSSVLETDSDMSVGLAKNELTKERKFIYGNNHLANLINNWWPVSSVIIKKNQFYWNEDMCVWEVIDYFSKLLLQNFKCTICPKVVTSINHMPREDRITHIYDHYNAEATFKFFSALKNDIIVANKIDPKITESIDRHLLSNAYSIYKQSKRLVSLENIEITNLKKYKWFKSFGISGFCSLLGFRNGIVVFYTLNRWLRRA